MKTNIYTMEDWAKDGTLSPAVGQYVENDVVWDLIESLPPAYWSHGLFQPGEAYTHERETGKALYQTFEQVNTDGVWQYMGLCRKGEKEPRKGWNE